ncbi:MAG TPA: hypothetical protein H9987_05945 [Candidatus Luteococcus avicola]|nr:hypothetical protein [Candidatus Luteococcus avicola]
MNSSTPRGAKRNPVMGLLVKLAGTRNLVLLVDTGFTALLGMGLVVLASRTMSPVNLATFSLAQMVIVTIVGLVRGAFYGPAMAAQRLTGRARVPVSWLWKVALPIGAVMSLLLAPLLARGGQSFSGWFVTLALASAAILAQDGIRAVLMSRELTVGALVSDACATCLAGVLALAGVFPASPRGILELWATAAATAFVLGMGWLFWKRTSVEQLADQSLAKTWSMGKWGALDVAFAASATLLPMFISALYLGSSSAGAYRALQTGMGPLNILHTTIVTAFGLDAWRNSDLAGLAALKKRVNRMGAILLGASSAYAVLALPLMAWISQVHDPHLWRVGLIVAVAGILGATSTPYNAAALALGYQKSGAIIRLVIVVATMAVSLPWSARTWVPWHDPIGAASLIVSVTSFLGWLLSYRLGVAKETVLLTARDNSTDTTTQRTTS